MDLCGWVKNLSDGNVEVVADLQREIEDIFINILKNECYGAVVRNIEAEEFIGEIHDEFQIKF